MNYMLRVAVLFLRLPVDAEISQVCAPKLDIFAFFFCPKTRKMGR